MRSRDDLVRGWIRKAESDLATARIVAVSPGPYDTACFHAQQRAEKYLKGFLTFAEQPFPFTHNLEQLKVLCLGVRSAPDFGGIDVALLTPYAVQLRYDAEFWPAQSVAHDAIDLAEQIRRVVLACLPPDLHPLA